MKKDVKSIVKTSDVIDVDVKNPEGEDLGKIKEIVLDKYTGQARYVVLSFGGFLGMGDKLFALPWEAISYNPQENAFILGIEKEKFKNAPGFDAGEWPNIEDQSWGEGIFKYYNMKPYWEGEKRE